MRDRFRVAGTGSRSRADALSRATRGRLYALPDALRIPRTRLRTACLAVDLDQRSTPPSKLRMETAGESGRVIIERGAAAIARSAGTDGRTSAPAMRSSRFLGMHH